MYRRSSAHGEQVSALPDQTYKACQRNVCLGEYWGFKKHFVVAWPTSHTTLPIISAVVVCQRLLESPDAHNFRYVLWLSKLWPCRIDLRATCQVCPMISLPETSAKAAFYTVLSPRSTLLSFVLGSQHSLLVRYARR